MSIQEAAGAAMSVFPGATIATSQGDLSLQTVMVAIAGSESGWTVDADGDCGLGGPSCGSCSGESGSATSWGLWQIHNVHSEMLTNYSGSGEACGWRSWLFNAANNAKAAFAIYEEQGLEAWSTWQSGAWASHVGAAQDALTALSAAPGPSESAENGGSQAITAGTAPAAPRHVPWVGWGLVGVSLLAAGATVAVVETDTHWSDIREWLGRPLA
ncbi:MAG: hypothetical protein M0Z85_00125 [Gammaproteobacteria bacterium]|nr:hypothetical protein [Gammaproteobacteria bacterium]